ncbi:MAG: glycosyltransferase [Bacteroidales bacterium]|jgi:glycosyltransferase involved in cell wall biosynthesis|nr:glycosyltransferase [Bacteroidales bacterium]
MKNFEENYISVIIAIRNDEKFLVQKITDIYSMLDNHFKYFEVIVVDNFSNDNTLKVLAELKLPITIITLSRQHSTQQVLTAGIEAAIGDYIVEIPDISVDFKCESIFDLYKKSQEGFDFIFLTPRKIRWSSIYFYKMLNRNFRSAISTPIMSSVITLSSRRGQNKTIDVGENPVNRTVTYVLTGLKCNFVSVDVTYYNRRNFAENTRFMIDTLIYYTDFISQSIVKLTLLFAALTAAGVVHALIFYLMGATISGWASTFLLCSTSFCAIFLILAVICKYLDHILAANNAKNYTFCSLIKKEKEMNDAAENSDHNNYNLQQEFVDKEIRRDAA